MNIRFYLVRAIKRQCSAMLRKVLSPRRNQLFLLAISLSGLYCLFSTKRVDYDFARRSAEIALQEALKTDKGMGCKVPQVDPFSNDILALEKDYPNVTCKGYDWIHCHLSKCKVKDILRKTAKNLRCVYRDIIYKTDTQYVFGNPVKKTGMYHTYVLMKSDHVKVRCRALFHGRWFTSNWVGVLTGFRGTVEIPKIPAQRQNSMDILMFGFESAAKNGFIRRMPKSFKYITETLNATVLNGYNVLGDGTPAALFPLLSGKNDFEFPDARKHVTGTSIDADEFIFKKMKKYGYRTAFFEDTALIGTFQYRFNGFNKQVSDHFLLPYLLENVKGRISQEHCVGEAPLFKMMMNVTEQFFETSGKHFCFTFIGDICHDVFGKISATDNDTVDFLDKLYKKGTFKNTMLIVFGDHGPRYASVRQTLNGKFEERLPLMAIRLPDSFRTIRPEAQANLESNVHVLTTAHDVHATVLDVLELGQLRNSYEVKGADIMRGLSLLEPIPQTRSCSEAGIVPHWCSCVEWRAVPLQQPVCGELVRRFLEFVNQLTQPYRDKCAERMLKSIEWVKRQVPKSSMVTFVEAIDYDGYIGKFNKNAMVDKGYYQLRVTLGPGDAIFEASAMYHNKDNKFTFSTRDISRITMYNDEPACISESHPDLNYYCYCI